MGRFGGESGYEGRREESFSESERLMAKIIETGPAIDPQKLAQMQAQLCQHLNIVGVLGDDGKINIQQWMDYLTDLTRKRNIPLRPDDYPDEETFNKGVLELKESDPELFDNVSPRGGKTMEDYLYGVGMVMANRLVYTSIFKDDPIVYGEGGKVENGRHRVIVQRVLNRVGYNTNWGWVES